MSGNSEYDHCPCKFSHPCISSLIYPFQLDLACHNPIHPDVSFAYALTHFPDCSHCWVFCDGFYALTFSGAFEK